MTQSSQLRYHTRLNKKLAMHLRNQRTIDLCPLQAMIPAPSGSAKDRSALDHLVPALTFQI